ncbi:MAG: potassium transporter Kup, partial [Mesorhizobium sp.]
HFGRKPIVLAWLAIVFPCLLLNYVGQGAFVLANGGVVGHPFFEMNQGWTLIPMVVLATAATVIACQAVISGAFSLTRQAVQLNMLPRLEILHTSEKQSGQIYMPRVNLLLALVVMLLVVGFGESSKLASAYGISVTGNMLVTTVLLYVVMTRIWKWQLWVAVSMTALFAFIDIGFFASNIVKVFEGGWASLAVAFTIILAMWTWVR